MLTFPLNLTWAEIAALPDAADAFSWDESYADDDTPDLAAYAANYATAYHSSNQLSNYLAEIGYSATEEGLTIKHASALYTAGALFNQILAEYDDLSDARCAENNWSTPTWILFGLGGDDDVDYCGSQPSCLTDLLIAMANAGDLA